MNDRSNLCNRLTEVQTLQEIASKVRKMKGKVGREEVQRRQSVAYISEIGEASSGGKVGEGTAVWMVGM